MFFSLRRWVQTEMGQALADAVGVQEPSVTVEESSRQVLKLVGFFSFSYFSCPVFSLHSPEDFAIVESC